MKYHSDHAGGVAGGTRGKFSRGSSAIILLAASHILVGSASARTIPGAEQAIVLEPQGGDTSGPKPVFRFEVDGSLEKGLRARVELSRDRWKSVDRSWDTRESASGWRFASDATAARRAGSFECIETLPEGLWEWRLKIFPDGRDEIASKPGIFSVDATPPAEVTGLRVQRQADGSVLLSWDAVLSDIEGRPETVDHYIVYRYEGRGIFAQPREAMLGETRALSLVDRPQPRKALSTTGRSRSVRDRGRSTVYYKVVASDAAGNELGRR